MTVPYCDVMEMPQAWCAHCKAPAPKPDVQVVHRMLARYPGACESCGDHIVPGDEIGSLRGEPGWVGACCLPAEE